MRGTSSMAEIIVKLRSHYVSGDFDDYWPFHVAVRLKVWGQPPDEPVATPMKKSLAPLIVIALVVAGIATGIFYQLVLGKLGVQAQATVGERKGSNSSAVGQATEVKPSPVPTGMRAISVHVGDSSGVLALLKPGQRVDVHVVHIRNHDDVGLRTVAEDLEVLTIALGGDQTAKSQLPVVTLLVTPTEANMLAVADSAARLRLTLRNPLDRDKPDLPNASLSAVMQSQRRSGK